MLAVVVLIRTKMSKSRDWMHNAASTLCTSHHLCLNLVNGPKVTNIYDLVV